MKTTNGNGHAKRDAHWLPMAQAKASTGLSERSIARYAASGKVSRRWSEETPQCWLYSTDDLDKIVTGSPSPDDERDLLLDAMVDALRVAQGHAIDAFKAAHEPARAVLDLLKGENGELRARCASLEASHVELIKAREEALNEAHARTLAEKAFAAKEARWDAVFKTLSESAPLVFTQAVETVLAWKTPEAGHALKALESMQDDVLIALLERANLDDDAKLFITKILERRQASRSQSSTSSSRRRTRSSSSSSESAKPSGASDGS